MKTIIKSINKCIEKYKKAFIFFIAFPHIYHVVFPNGSIAIIEFLTSRFRLLSFLMILVLFCVNRKKPSKLLIASFVYCFFISLSTILNNIENFTHALLFISSFLGLALLVEYFSSDIKVLIEPLLLCFEIQIYPNFITVLLYRNVIESSGYNINKFFLGTANDLILYLLPAFFLCVLYIKILKKSYRPMILILVIIATVILSDSFTTMASLLFFTIIFLYCELIRKNRVDYPIVLFLIPAIMFVVVVLPYLFFNENRIMQYIFDNVYYNHSFECRTYIWIDAKKYILQKPILGFGYYNDNLIMIGNENDIYGSAHNTVIQIILNYGLIGLLSFIVILYVLIYKICRIKVCFYKSFFISIICSIFITFISQDYHRIFELQIIFFIIYFFENYKDRILDDKIGI